MQRRNCLPEGCAGTVMKCDTQGWGREGAQSVRAFSLVFLFNVEGWLPPGGIWHSANAPHMGRTPLSVIAPKFHSHTLRNGPIGVPQSRGEDVSYLPPYFSIKFTERCLGPLLRLVK